MALAGIVTMFTMQACDGDNRQYIPQVEASEEVDRELVAIEQYKPFYAIYVKFDDGTEFKCIAVENSGNDSKTSALGCK